MSCKSALFTSNTTSQTLAVGNTINLGSIVRRFGSNLNLSGSNNISIAGPGYYQLNVSITGSPTAAGTLTVTAYKDGTAIPGAIASQSTSVAGNAVNLNLTSIIRETGCCCSDSISNVTLVLSGAAGTLTNVAVTVEKL